MHNKHSYLVSMAGLMVSLGAIAPALTCQFIPPAHAQIIPDGTLSTTVTSSDNQNFVIENGDRTGNNLFHSFDTFSIPTNGSAVFNNPTDIENIFSRVTGLSLSNIDGLLQTIGTTNLFLLNPNGIILGPNAQLDIAGSFTASTANSLVFADGAEFSAIAPEPSLLSISVPLGLQLNTQPQGDIESRGQLEAGQDLTLLGQNLYLEGEIIAGNDLTLQAQDTVTMKDTLVYSGNDLTVQGGQGIDILALNRLEPVPFASGGNLTLISDGNISADTHFESGGNFQFLMLAGTPATVVSFYDPIILADGNVVLGDYTGVALKLEAKGSIDAGDIVITGPDTTLSADGSGSDVNLLASSRAAILRAGVNADPGQPPGSITVSSINTSDVTGGDGGPIILEAAGDITANGFFLGPLDIPITLGSFSFADGEDSGTGGAITISSGSGNISLQGNRQSTFPFNGFANGPITVGSFSLSARNDSGRGGPIRITADAGKIDIVGDLNTQSYAFQNDDSSLPAGDSSTGGDITLVSNIGDITIDGLLTTLSGSFGSFPGSSPAGNSRDAGNIFLSSGSGDIRLVNNQGGRILDTTSKSQALGSIAGDSGDGGNITVSSTTGDIVTDGAFVVAGSSSEAFAPTAASSSGNSGNGGNIIFSSTSGNITINSVLQSSAGSGGNSSVSHTSGSSGDGGNISITSDSGTITLNPPDTEFFRLFPESAFISSIARSSGGLNTEVQISESVTISSGNSGNGGDIAVASNSGDITINTNLRSESSSVVTSRLESSDDSGNGSNITLTAGDSGNGGDITVSSNSGEIIVNAGLSSKSSSSSQPATDSFSGGIAFFSGDSGNGGDIVVSSNVNDITINASLSSASSTSATANSNSLGDTGNAAGGGGITISTRSGNIQVNEDLLTLSNATSGTAGRGGGIALSSRGGAVVGNDNSLIVVSIGEQPEATGAGGAVTLEAHQAISGLNILTFANTGPSGNVDINGLGEQLTVSDVALIVALQDSFVSPIGDLQEITLDNETNFTSGQTVIASLGDLTLNNVSIAASANSTQPSGNVTLISPDQVTILNSQINSNASNTGLAGNIEINAESLTLVDTSLSTSTTGPGRAGDIRLNLSDILILDGSTLTSSTELDSTGQGGNIEVNATVPNLEATLRNGAQLAVNSAGQGEGGNISVTAQRLTLDDASQINATTLSSDGGNVTLMLGDLLLLRNGSEISTTAGIAEAGGDGGDISITLADGLIVALPNENSDITANAFEGDGGNIQITADGIVGLQFRPELTPLSDITASSQFGVDGIVQIQTPDLDASQGTVELPSDLTDPSRQISTGCLVAVDNSLVITGRSGLPENPNILDNPAIWEDWRPLETESEMRSAIPTVLMPTLPTALREATEMVRNTNGQVQFVATRPDTNIGPTNTHCLSLG
ncbi:filamentous hemagglutinin family n-terminal domain protein [Leptolyngbya sp. Heron Island J]|uniref:two-partner secretion domain-containing protein n=1 Tax=Leptolyngbya sp. Heron Island J TaxID=1385935 RepID=UPI0003B9C430|nr:filamentous hemagglutinin N-terminal domain-containing protein [Leptolyngbya sp. Heron Island J]ESA36005.1 filamentous hemagglutinin family n-terminal domain protein [Leptolyngbya sp. Heron Island J]